MGDVWAILVWYVSCIGQWGDVYVSAAVVSLWCMTERGDVHMCDVWFSEVMYDPTGDVCVMCRPVGL